jgi:hypothetical protein
MSKSGPVQTGTAEVVALLDLTVESLSAIDGADDRRIQFRNAITLANDLVDRVRASDPSAFPEHFSKRVVDARHCLTMGKPRECLVMFQSLQDDLKAFWTE